MMMIKTIDTDRIAGTNFSPAFEVSAPITWFTQHDIAFSRAMDDLDEYEYAALHADGIGALILTHYLNGPADTMTVMLPDAREGTLEIAPAVEILARAFHLPPSVFHWREAGEPVSGAARNTGDAA